jgi:methylglutaconyl-CoA hydratase
MTYRFVTTHREGAIEHLALNRPDVRNAFNAELIEELLAWAEQVSKDPSVRAVVVSGTGSVFCAGADLAWMSKMAGYSREENVRDATIAARMFAALNGLSVPLIARVHGAALGGGAGLAAVCDVVVAEENAVFGFTEVKLGVIPAVIAPYALTKIGESAARELFLTGARFGAVRAREIGLVHSIVPHEQLDSAVEAFVNEFLGAGPEAIAHAKALLARLSAGARDASLQQTDLIALTAEAIADRRASAEGQDGLRAFLEKRKPRWMDT